MDRDELRETILNTVSDVAAKFMYYERKEDSKLGVGDIERAIENDVITADEIIDKFREECGEAFV